MDCVERLSSLNDSEDSSPALGEMERAEERGDPTGEEAGLISLELRKEGLIRSDTEDRLLFLEREPPLDLLGEL